MKKQVKKLVLAKETLRTLDSFEVENGVGGLSNNCSVTCTFKTNCGCADTLSHTCDGCGSELC
jgi:hypothetical protein